MKYQIYASILRFLTRCKNLAIFNKLWVLPVYNASLRRSEWQNYQGQTFFGPPAFNTKYNATITIFTLYETFPFSFLIAPSADRNVAATTCWC